MIAVDLVCNTLVDSTSCSGNNKCDWLKTKCGGGLVNCTTITDQTTCTANDCAFNDANCATDA